MAHSEEVLRESLSANLAVEPGRPGFKSIVNILVAYSREFRFETLSAGLAGEERAVVPAERRAGFLWGNFSARTLRYCF